ncbi:MAG: NAD(FAD)-dependent dehydrogenase, partial [Ignavibacteriales bacterium]
LENDGSVKVDEYLQAHQDFYAAGDIASFPYRGKYVRIEHWRVAEQQGRVAGFNMAGKKNKFLKQPFFWTQQAGLNLRYVGHTEKWDDTYTKGDITSKEFIVFLSSNGNVQAVIGNNKDTEMDAVEFLMLNNKMPTMQELKESTIDLIKLVNNLSP